MSTTECQTEPRKLITDLKVSELKAELEKRSLDKGGVKATLIERLEKALVDEGLNPQTHSFNLLDTTLAGETPLKKQLRSTSMECATPLDCMKEEPMDTSPVYNTAPTDMQPKQVDVGAESVGNGCLHVDAKHIAPPPSITEKESEEVVIGDDDVEIAELADGNKKTQSQQMQTAGEVVKLGEKGTEKSGESNCLSPKITYSTPTATPAASTASPAAVQKKAAASEKNGDTNLAASMWIKGISNSTKAADLKMLFSKCGRVVAAKIFTTKNKQSPSCFGYITMGDASMAELCLQKLNRTNLKGKLISVEKATRSLLPQISKAGKTQPNKPTPAISTTVAAQPTEQEPTKSASINKECSPEVIIEGVTTAVAKRPLVKAVTESVKKAGEAAPKPRIISTKPAKRITPPKDSGSPATTSNKSASLHRSSRPLSRRFISTTSSSTYQQLRSTTNKHVLSRYNNRGGTGGTNLRLHSTHRPFEFNTSRGAAGQFRMSRGGPAALPGRPSSYRSNNNISPERGSVDIHSKSSMSSWEREEMIRLMRRKEEEYRKKEEELKMERERERLRFERERLEREKLEVKQLKLTAQLANAQFAFMAAGNRDSLPTADSGRRSSKVVDRAEKGHKHLYSAPISSAYSGTNNKYLEDRSRRDGRDKHRSRSRSHVKEGKDTVYKGSSSSLSKFGYGNSKQSLDQYNQQVNRFIEGSALPRSSQHKTFGGTDAAKPNFGGRVRGSRTVIDISPPRTSAGRSPRHPGGSRGGRDQSSTNPSSFGRTPTMLDPLPNPNSAQFRTDPSYASRVGLHSNNGAGRNADEMFGGLSSTPQIGAGNRDNSGSNYRDLPTYQNTPSWVGGGGSRTYIPSGNTVATSTTANTSNWPQQQEGGNSFWSNSNSVGRSNEWSNSLSNNQQQQQTNQSSRYASSYDNANKHSSYSRRY